MGAARPHWEITNLPFMYTALGEPTNGEGLPDRLPFALGVDEATGRLLQEPSSVVSEALAEAYKRGSMISGQMDEEGIGRTYTDAFLEFVHGGEVLPELVGAKVLEIGCGTGYLLYRLKDLGAEVLGVEPGEHGQEKFEAKGVEIVRDFFPTPRITEKFDAIVMYGVLEHVEDPSGFLRLLGESLREGGRIIVAVPDCEPYIELGDISMLIHEHWSFFTEATLRNTIGLGGYDRVHVAHSSVGGFLYASMRMESDAVGAPVSAEAAAEVERAGEFIAKARGGTARLIAFVNDAHKQGRSLGIYVPGRAINSLVTGQAELDHCRFFDDNALLHQTYFPGVTSPIESRDDLIASPVDHVLVMSHSFGAQIVAQLAPLLPETTKVTSIEELLKA